MEFITNKVVFDTYLKQTDGTVKQKVSCTYAILNKLCKESNVCWDFSEKIFNREKKIEGLIKKRREIRFKTTDEIESWEKEVFVQTKAVVENQQLPPTGPVECGMSSQIKTEKRGRPKKRLSDDPGDKTSHKILDNLLDNLACFAKEHNVTTGALLRALMERWAQHSSEEEVSVNKSDMTDLQAVSLIYNINLSLNQYQELRLELLKHGFKLPVRNEVDTEKKTLLPLSITSAEVKTSCDIEEVISQTVLSLLEVNDIAQETDLKVIAKFGLDGSGSHRICHQNAAAPDVDDSSEDSETDDDEEKKTSSYLGGFWCPLKIFSTNQGLLWNNPLPNSILFARPVSLVREKETRDSVSEHFKPHMDKLAEMEKETTSFGGNCSANVVTQISMIDGKMVDLIQGDSGAFCHYCDATREDANNIEKIAKGFRIEKTVEKCLQAWQSVDSGEISYNNKERAGQVHKPLNVRDIRYYGITHQKLRSLDHMEKLLYHLVSGQTQTWSERNYRVKDALKVAKKETIEHIRQKLGFLIDTPTSGGGNTDTGGITDRFFSIESREDICVLILNKSDRDAYRKLLQLYNMVLSVSQTVDPSKRAIPTEVKALCQELMMFEKTSFPWSMLSPSIHSMCGHNWELFELNLGESIAIFSEQGSEAWNKHIRAYKSGPSARARQTSIKENINDIFNRMMIKTHPKIATQKRQVSCKRCKRIGHTIRSCPSLVSTAIDWEHARIQQCFE